MLGFKADFYEKVCKSLENSAVVMKVDDNGKYFPIWCSKEFEEMIEGTAEEFIKLDSVGIMDSVHPEDRAEVEYLFKNHITKSGTKSLNIRKRTMKGKWLWLNVHYAFVEEGGAWYAYCNYFDVTAIKENERHAKKLYETVRAELDNISKESLASLRLNLTKDLIEECSGKDLYEIDATGFSISENFDKRLESFPLERDRKKFAEKFQTKSLLKGYDEGETMLTEIFFSKRPSGRKCFVEYKINLSQDPATGDIIAFVVERDYNAEMVNDVILYKALVEQYDMITYIVDGDYGVVIGDKSKVKRGGIFPRKRNGKYETYLEEQIKPVLTGTLEEQRNQLAALSLERIEKSLTVREPYEVNIACYINGEIFYKRFVFYLLDKEAKFYILLKSDTTQLQRTQLMRNAQLKAALDTANQANVAKTAFLSSMSHEIRTPMNAIIGLNSIALNEPGISDKTRDHLEKIGASARHLLSLINDILDMSRIESGRMILKNEDFNFGEMLEQINTMIGGQCSEKNLIYECKVVGKVDEFYIGDAMKLKQVLINILGNAVKFTPAPGTITFSVENINEFDNRATLRFLIKDTGIGMDEEYLPKIFEVFSQEDSNTTNAYGGTGLGMPITKSIVEMMNGVITVKSQKNIGSEFTVTVTLRTSDRVDQSKWQGIKAQDLNVLVIDDDTVACEHAKIVLEELGIAADIAKSGRDAIEMVKLRQARHEPYNLLFIDWKMPDIDGIEVTRQIREIIGNDSAIIFLTAYNWDEVADKATNAGVDRFMAKPLFASHVMEEFIQVMRQKNISFKKSKKLADLAGRKILLAEDMLVNAEIMKELLKMRDMEVEHAENGQIVVDMFEKSPLNYYDAILMDVRMPVVDGLRATRMIRKLNRADAKTIPIIAMTANAFDEDVQRSLQSGMNAHLSKPVEPEHMYQTLQELIAD